jgi:hypothetical protein
LNTLWLRAVEVVVMTRAVAAVLGDLELHQVFLLRLAPQSQLLLAVAVVVAVAAPPKAVRALILCLARLPLTAVAVVDQSALWMALLAALAAVADG